MRLPKPPPKGTRCPVCMGFVKEDHYCVAREGKDLYYFDEEERLKRFLECLSEYKRLRKLNIKSIGDVFVKGWEGWRRAENYLSELK